MSQEHVVLLMARLGILANATPKQLGLGFRVDTSEQEITANELKALAAGLEDRLYAEDDDDGLINMRACAHEGADVRGKLYGRLRVSEDVARLLATFIDDPNIGVEVVGPDGGGRVMLYSTEIPLRDWLYGAILLSPAPYVIRPPWREVCDGFGVKS